MRLVSMFIFVALQLIQQLLSEGVLGARNILGAKSIMNKMNKTLCPYGFHI